MERPTYLGKRESGRRPATIRARIVRAGFGRARRQSLMSSGGTSSHMKRGGNNLVCPYRPDTRSGDSSIADVLVRVWRERFHLRAPRGEVSGTTPIASGVQGLVMAFSRVSRQVLAGL